MPPHSRLEERRSSILHRRSMTVHSAFRLPVLTPLMVEFYKGGTTMKIFAAVLLAVCMSAGAAQAKVMHHHMHIHHHMHMRMAACAEGAVKASCVCKAASGAHAMCKAGQWCHSFAGMCTQ